MSNIASSAMSHQARSPQAGPPGAKAQVFAGGTRNLLDEARNVVENATQQGQELNPMIYQMLGMEPQFEDHSADLQASQGEFDAAQKQWDEANKTFTQLKGIPKGKRTLEQRKQLRQLKPQMAGLQRALGAARDAHGRLATMPKTITGFSRLDPEHIPPTSPFSAQNPLYQIQRTEAERAQQSLAGGAVDPTLVHQYTVAESQLRAKLAARYGPDYENSSVGQMALQNFERQKSESFATWNFNAAQQYANQAFSQAGAQQSLMANLTSLYREPSGAEAGMGANLSNLAGQRLSETQSDLNERMARQGMMVTQQTSSPMAGVGALGSLLTTPIGPQGQTGAGYLGKGAGWMGQGIAGLAGEGATAAGMYGPMVSGYATGAGAAAADAAISGASTYAASEGGAGIGALLAA